MNKKIKYGLWNVIRLSIVVLIFVYLYRAEQLDFTRIVVLGEVPLVSFAAVLLVVTAMVLAIIRWRILLADKDLDPGMGPATQLTFIGYLFSMVLPGSVTGDLVKGYYLCRRQTQKTVLATTIIVDRLIGLYTVFLIAAVAVSLRFISDGMTLSSGIWAQAAMQVLASFIVLVGFGLTFCGIIFMTVGPKLQPAIIKFTDRLPLGPRISRLVEAMGTYSGNPRLSAKVLWVSVFSQLPMFAAMGLIAWLLGVRSLSVMDLLFILPVSMMFNSIPLAPGGWGVGEIGFQAMFRLYSVDCGAEIAFIFRIIYLLLSVFFGGIAYSILGKRILVEHESSAMAAEE